MKSEKKAKLRLKTYKPIQFWIPWWKIFAENLKNFRLKCEIHLEKCFFQRKCFPWKQSCGHLQCSSDRAANKILRKIRKKVGINPIKNLESKAVLTTVLETFCRKTEKSPSKMRNTIWKVFFFSKKMLLMKTILWTHRVQFRQTSLKNFA